MTVCVAGLAAESKAIVCVADKALSYGELIQWDADSSKMIQVNPSGSLIMFSGSESGISRVMGNILATEEEVGAGKPHTLAWVEKQYKQALDDLLQLTFLNPHLLTREQYVVAITASEINPYIRRLAEQVDTFNANCDLLVCGFDFLSNVERKSSPDLPFILCVSHPGIATDMTHTGFHAIGSGWEKAVSRLLFSEHKRSNSIERVLYDAFDAKANAEMVPGVGFEWDAKVIIGGATEKPTLTHDVPKHKGVDRKSVGTV